MKKIIKRSLVVLSALSLVWMFDACRKPKCPDDPCLNPVLVTALDTDSYGRGHFTMTDANGGMEWLYATNWNSYASQVIPGRQYQIGYREVPCPESNYTNQGRGIASGGCVIGYRKCIVIKCLKPVKEKGCFESLVNPYAPVESNPQNVQSAFIEGNSLKARIGFSGCTEEEYKTIKLHLMLEPDNTMKPLSRPVFTARAVNVNREVTCMAYFEKDVCFDLSAIRRWYVSQGFAVPSEVSIQMQVGGQQLTYAYVP